MLFRSREVESLRGAWFPWPVSTLTNQQIALVERCDALEVILQWDCANSTAEHYGIRLGTGLRVYVDAQMQRLVLERYYPQYGLCGSRSVALNLNNALNLRLFFDRSSVEVFVNEGEACLSSRIYPDEDCRDLALFAWTGEASLIYGGAWQLE